MWNDFSNFEQIDAFLNYTQQQAGAYATDHIMVTMGSDFTYQDANVWYKNMDKLIKYSQTMNLYKLDGHFFQIYP